MTNPKRTVWCVSDGRAGIERQTTAVAHALSELLPVEIHTLHLNPTGLQVSLPPGLWLAPKAALSDEQSSHLKPPWPDIWIANGRRSVPYSMAMRGWSKRRTMVVQLQDPRVNANRFDLVAPPVHDNLSGANVVQTLGAPVWFTAKQIERARALLPLPRIDGHPTFMVILGGTSKRHRFTKARAHAIIAELRRLASKGMRFVITTSRRTPADVEAQFYAYTYSENIPFFANEARDGPNPYLAWLSQVDGAFVTEDSTNMMTDAAFFGLPIHLLKLDGGDKKFDRLHELFIERGAARWHDGTVEPWSYEPVRDAMDIAHAIASHVTSAEA